ncbi:hypothetical protein J6Z39_08275 [bacterium]|jgi:Tfp pilus assembly protein PilO|nr:hypothetical protein [bacterium]
MKKKKILFAVSIIIALIAVAGGIYLTQQEQNLEKTARKVEEIKNNGQRQQVKGDNNKKLYIKKDLINKGLLRKSIKMRKDNNMPQKDESGKTCSDY